MMIQTSHPTACTDIVPCVDQSMLTFARGGEGRTIDIPYAELAEVMDYQTFVDIGRMPLRRRLTALRCVVRPAVNRGVRHYVLVDERNGLVTAMF